MAPVLKIIFFGLFYIMASPKHFFESSYKKFGLLALGGQEDVKPEEYSNYIKILYLPKGFNVTIDFNSFNIQDDSLFFIKHQSISGN
ncbi:MAG: hypothetical protein WDM90_19660 [Ferruginibacter sp.]